eukprot:TRINITY_DN2832_c0_g1_i1.p1 TRINITY_DN2832_c0_g1~~TRINITY_DN2832_c0_g1_i1.p1  ORF type:complete len:213 (-),score=66.08 TRINITY_DN2832_c0_g1_i1:194-805(-)
MSKPKITYFDLPGRAEISRLILVQAGVDFDDERVTREAFAGMKANLPYGQLPMLEVDGHTICQSITMARFLANKYGLAGNTAMEKAYADEAVDALGDIGVAMMPMYRALRENDLATKKEKTPECVAKAEPMFQNLEKRMTSRGGKYLAGDTLTWADLYFGNMCYMAKMLGVTSVMDKCPNLKDLAARVADLPAIKKWNQDHNQ